MKLSLHIFLATALLSSSASAITREEVLVRARAYSAHRWSSTASNQKATCSAAYQSLFPPGDYVGVAYDWGGYMTLRTFDEQIAAGYGAGSQETDGILACTSGVDCSGFVSMAWGAGHFTTSSLHQTSAQITKADLLPGDVLNQAGFHVAVFTHLLQSGEPALIEAVGYNVHVNTYGGWSYVNGYVPRRYTNITGTTAGNPAGTTSNPIVIGGFPFSDTRSTKDSPSSVLDACGAAPNIPQKGPEVVYVVDIAQPGTLSIAATDDAATDVDVQLLDNLSTTGCKARNDSSLSAQVGCGRYWIVVDTYGANATKAGPYSLSVSFAPSGQACGAVSGPPAFNPKGKLGDACAYPGNQSLPFCNPNLGSETCIYGNASSFCSKACDTSSDCTDLGAAACCQDLGKGEKYCLTKSFCGTSGATTTPSPTPDGGTKKDGGDSTGTGDGNEAPRPATDEDEGAPSEQLGEVKVSNAGGCGIARNAPSRPGTAMLLLALAITASACRARPRRLLPPPHAARRASSSSCREEEERSS